MFSPSKNVVGRLAQWFLWSLLVLNVHGEVSLEKYFRCHRTDPQFNKCVIDILNELQPIRADGVPDLGLEPFDPLVIAKLVMDDVEGVKFKQVLTDITITGLKQAKVIKGDFTKLPNSMEMTWEVPDLRVKNNYTMEGVIMGIPLKGKGQSSFNCTQIHDKVKLKTELVKINGEDYLQVKDVKYTIEPPKTAKLRFTNTLSKDKKLTEATSKMFNDNWRTLFDTFKNVRNADIERVIQDGLNQFLGLYPYDKMFPA
uniref:Circadian clock-controlled protein n=1 Tax=Cacopsylla melanoneura TaxID=428564 RepID=A0A8D9FIA0_9HEMI